MTKSSESGGHQPKKSTSDQQQPQHQAPAWPIDQEMNLFGALRGHKPVGVDRHFQMLYISEKLNAAQRERGLPPVPIRDIWSLLDGLYSMPALHDSEVLPFANREAEFSLPVDSPDWKPVMAMEFPRVTATAATARSQRGSSGSGSDAGGGPGASSGSERKRGRPPRIPGAAGAASPLAAPSSRSHSPAPSGSDTGGDTSGAASAAKKIKR